MGSIDKSFLRPDNNERKGDGVHRQGLEGPFGHRMSGGEVVDSNMDPEEALMAKEQEDAAEAADRGMTLKQYRDFQKRQRSDKAA